MFKNKNDSLMLYLKEFFGGNDLKRKLTYKII